uniref:hypothetical protein n=1 Tax=Escherichia coli TaxID=562 RepID=UPI000BDE880C
GTQAVLNKHPFLGVFLIFLGFKFLSMNAPAGCYLHPFESRSPQGRKPARAMADVQGAVYRVPFTLDS